MPMPAPFDGYIEVLARVSSTCLVTMQRNRYSVPCRLANQMVAVHQYADRIEIVHDYAVAARHIRLLDSDQISYNWQHYIPVIEKKPRALRNGAPFAELPAPLLQLQTALRRKEHQQTDRIMAKYSVWYRRMGWKRCWSPLNWCWNPVHPVPNMLPTYWRG